MTTQWIEISEDLGSQLWHVLKQHMGRGTQTIHVHASFSDPTTGEYGHQPTMMTIVGPYGGASLLKVVTKWTLPDRLDAVTRYWLPAEVPET